MTSSQTTLPPVNLSVQNSFISLLNLFQATDGLDAAGIQLWIFFGSDNTVPVNQCEQKIPSIRCKLSEQKHMFMSTFNLFQATAGLDGAVILYDFESDYSINTRCYIQVWFDPSEYYIISLFAVIGSGFIPRPLCQASNRHRE